MIDLLSCCFGEEEGRKVGMWSSPDNKEEHEAKKHSVTKENQIKLHQRANKVRHPTIYAKPIDVDQDFEFPNFPKQSNERDFIDQSLEDNFIFSHLNPKECKLLIDAMEQQLVAKGTNVIEEGEIGDFFYILQDGLIDISVDGVHVGNCVKGASFGELALLYDSPRNATCTAKSDCVLWKVDQLTFRNMMARSAQQLQQGLCATFEKIPLFAHMGRAELNKFVDALTPATYDEGERIVTKGEIGDIFYIVSEGTVKCHNIGMGDAQYADQLLLTVGDWFGERALLTGEPRAANVTAVSDVTCFTLDRETFEASFGCLQTNINLGLKKKLLRTLPIFTNSNFDSHEIDELARLMLEQCFLKGQKLCEAGKPVPQNLWIIEKGRIVVTNTDGNLYTLESGDYYGDKTIKEQEGIISKQTSVFEENTTCHVLTRSDIEHVIGDIERLGDYIPFAPSKSNRALGFQDLKLHRVLGQGAFGKVWLVSHDSDTDDAPPYALKQLDKRHLIKNGQVTSIHREKNIMYSVKHPFLLSLISSFQDEHHVYLLLELMQGGDLFLLLHTAKSDCVPNSHAVFYASCVIEALGHLHQRSIVYRDLKPENIMIGADGYCTVIDLGFAKVVMDKTYTLCGTPEYLAPEIIMSKGHNQAADHWAFGVLIYEMLVGRTPFFFVGSDQIAMFKRIVMGKYEIPTKVDDSAKDLIQKLLVRRPAARLGNLCRGHHDIQDHAWFKNVDWKKLLRKEIQAPWIPAILDPFDTSHFDDMSHVRKSMHQSQLEKEQQSLFKDF